LAAKTPWNRVRACPGLDPGFTLGFGTNAASLARKSIGSNTTYRNAARLYRAQSIRFAHGASFPGKVS
jgi:hypothetical protein